MTLERGEGECGPDVIRYVCEGGGVGRGRVQGRDGEGGGIVSRECFGQFRRAADQGDMKRPYGRGAAECVCVCVCVCVRGAGGGGGGTSHLGGRSGDG